MSWLAISKHPSGRNNGWAHTEWPGVLIQHCGHPTALRPYYINIVQRRAFRTLRQACEFVETKVWPIVGGEE